MAFDRGLARLLLEVCRYTYADHVGNPANAAGRADSLKEIQACAADAGAPIPVRDHKGVATSAALSLPRAGVNEVCFMGTEGVGSLCYGDGRSPFRIDLSAREEDELFTSRLRALNTAKTDLIEHHHLRGTTAETARGEVGNYTKILDM
jgi:hypothetical protein